MKLRKTLAASVVGLAAASLGVIVAPGWASPQDRLVPAPGPGGPGGGFGPGTFLGPQILEAADADKDGRLTPEEAAKAAEAFIRAADKDKKGSIDAAAFGRAINLKIGPPPGFGGGPDAPPPGDFGPGTFFGPQVLAGADANKDGRLSPEEAAKAAEAFVREADRDKKGSIDAEALGSAMNRRMGPPPGFGGPGGPMGQERKVLKQFDEDRNGRLDKAERQKAREFVKKEKEKGPGGPGRPGFGPPGGFGGGDEKGTPGPHVDPSEVAKYPGKPLYDPTVLRTIFLEFEDKGWEAEMADFYKTDVDVPATMTVDGKTYPGVGVHFRGMSSFFAVREGSKRSLNVSIDFTNPKQKIGDIKTLNLLNAHEDPTLLHTVLYFHIARNYLPAPKANLVKVVINGESWGIYTSAQQFDKAFLAENFPDPDGTRWKVQGSPGARGGLEYIGDDIEAYKKTYSIKSSDNAKAWKALVNLCRVLNETPSDQLEAALTPILDIDSTLWFLALDNALINNDGYWTRASDYTIYLDTKGKFHIIPHDANETFGPAMMFGPGGPGGRRGPGGRGGPGGLQAGRAVLRVDRAGLRVDREAGLRVEVGAVLADGPVARASNWTRSSAWTTRRSPCAVSCWRCPR